MFIKGRRLNHGTSVAGINTSVSRAHTPQARSRLGLQVHPSPPAQRGTSRSRRAASNVEDDDEDADNDADADGDIDDQEESGDPEDKGLYCFCQKMSYGEVRWLYSRLETGTKVYVALQMIGCDNDNCPYQWVSDQLLSPPFPGRFVPGHDLDNIPAGHYVPNFITLDLVPLTDYFID